jgi:hypothetical protein
MSDLPKLLTQPFLKTIVSTVLQVINKYYF